MPGNNGFEPLRKFALDNMQIGSTDSAGQYLQQRRALPWLFNWHRSDRKRSITDRGWVPKHRCTHVRGFHHKISWECNIVRGNGFAR